VTDVSQPYKFLDFYDFDEAAKFFGRERETEVLLSDIVATRLVLLFARTGSGKTSLINAGARPRLERELGYRTFYVRVERDPVKSARTALKAARLLPKRIVHKSLAFQLRDTVRRLRKPVVVFFDQFEEFFLYVAHSAPEKAHQFIANVGELYRDHGSGVHFVFSFREEFFIEMDMFRDEIPTIFHNDSNLRLLWLDREQAREAVMEPARAARFKVDDDLAERLLSDLAQEDRAGTGRVEPARLQIVCDTLWRERAHGRATLELYERLGGAEKILDRRLEEDINEELGDGQLRLFERLIPHLANEERGTKYVRGFDELVRELVTDRESLRETIEQLKKLHLLRESTHYGEVYVEWMSDYLAERTQYLRDRVRVISLRRLLARAVEAARRRSRQESGGRKKTAHPVVKPPTEEALGELYMAPADFEEVSAGAALLEDLTTAELEFLFVAALEHGTHMKLWFDKAQRDADGRAAAWGVLKDRIENTEARVEQCENAVRLLATLKPRRAETLLRRALKQKAVATTAISIIGELADPERAVSLLKLALKDKDLKKPSVLALGQIKSPEAVGVLANLLSDADTAPEAAGALEKLSKGRNAKVASPAAGVLARWQKSQQKAQSPPSNFDAAGPASFRPPAPRAGRKGLSESVWASLLHRVRDGALIPFVGPHTSPQYEEDIARIANRWMGGSFQRGYAGLDIPRLALLMSRRYDPSLVKRRLAFDIAHLSRRARRPDEVHEALSRLPLPVYFTATYTDQLKTALTRLGKKSKILQPLALNMRAQELGILALNWDKTREEDRLLSFASPTAPVLYHLLGHFSRPKEMVLTEDDYLDLLVRLRGRDSLPDLLLKRILSGLNIFIGFDPDGWEFRLINKGLLLRRPTYDKRMSVIQLRPDAPSVDDYAEMGGRPYEYYFERLGFQVYWGTAEEFAAELLERWEKFSK
jgi:hypothetical protein